MSSAGKLNVRKNTGTSWDGWYPGLKRWVREEFDPAFDRFAEKHGLVIVDSRSAHIAAALGAKKAKGNPQ